jgi:hypothetical protein
MSPSLLASRFINSTNKNVFLTGKAGTGKTTFLKEIIQKTHKKAVIVAPTGIAAINAGGVTIHSLFQLPFGTFIPGSQNFSGFNSQVKVNDTSSLFRNLQMNGVKKNLLREIELLIIDEVSMLRADLLDAIDAVLKHVRKQYNRSFGGVQVLFIGDLLQLPPVVKDEEWKILRSHYKSIYFFDSQVLQKDKPLYIELDKIYRQSDDVFISILNNLRSDSVSQEDFEILNRYYKPGFKPKEDENYIHLTTHNRKADQLNSESLQSLKGKSYFFKASIEGEFNEYAHPVEDTLELKKGAQVMFIKNDPTGAQRFFNGKIGTIVDLNDELIQVAFNDGSLPVNVEKYEWQNIKYKLNETTNEIDENVTGTFTQYPIKLAWAITVHKSQGLTFEKAIIDIENAFAPGQVYVALSRLTSLKGLILSRPINFRSISQDEVISRFSETRETKSSLVQILEEESEVFIRDLVLKCFNYNELSSEIKFHTDSYTKDEQKSTKQKYFEWAMKLKADFEPVKVVADKFLGQVNRIFENKNDQYLLNLQERVNSAKEYFTPILKNFSREILKQIEELKKEKKIKIFATELLALESSFYKQLQMVNKAAGFLQSVLSNTEFTKQSQSNLSEKEKRIEELNKSLEGTSRKRKDRKTKGEKEKKPDTKMLTYNLYKEGKNLKEIAAERGMAMTTIEGHLAHFVAQGLINAETFVAGTKIEAIISKAKEFKSSLLTPLKQELGEGYTYSDIRFAIAHQNFLEKSNN